jgi:hypothetical protein
MEWVRDRFLNGAQLLDNESFNRAVQTFDSAIWAHRTGSAIIMAWAALEAIFRPGRHQTTKTLSTCIATFLHPPGPQRDKAYQSIVSLYEVRGSAAHGAQIPEGEQLLDTFDLARRSLIKCLDSGTIPDPHELTVRWKERR